MQNLLASKLDYILQHRADYIRHIRVYITRKTLMIFSSSLIIFLIVCQILFNQNKNVFTWSSDTKIYFSPNLKTFFNRFNDSTIMRDKAQGPATCLLIIRTADGAFGNRMFLFASAYGLARLHQCKLYVAPWILNDLRAIFLININQTKVQLTTDDSEVVNRTDIYGRYSACTLYSDLFRIPFNKTFSRYEMVGFYQAYGYFEKYRDEISFLFQFNSGAISKNVPLVEQLLKG